MNNSTLKQSAVYSQQVDSVRDELGEGFRQEFDMMMPTQSQDQAPNAADQQVEDVDQEPDAAYHGEDHNVADLELDAQQYSAR